MSERPKGLSRDVQSADKRPPSINADQIKEESAARYRNAVEQLNSIREREIQNALSRHA